MSDTTKILIVEDNPMDAELMARAMTQMGLVCDCHRVDTPKTLEAALAGKWDAVLVDIDIPEMSIETTVATVQRLTHNIPVIVVSGSADDEHVARCLEYGVDDYILKDRMARLGFAVIRSMSYYHILENSHRQMRFNEAIIHACPDAIGVIDRTGKILFQSKRTEKVLGYLPEEMVGRDAFDFIDPSQMDIAKALFAGVLRRPNEDIDRYIRFRTSSGYKPQEYILLQVRGRNMLDDPDVNAILVFFHEVQPGEVGGGGNGYAKRRTKRATQARYARTD